MITVRDTLDAHAGGLSPVETIRRILPKLQEDPAVWITRFDDAYLLEAARKLESEASRGLPLRGVPFAVKDNIDVAGLPTTAACPAFSYMPESNAFVVQRLLDAGAICVGKTNMDQFATGLVGTRSPYGIPQNPHGAQFIPGGSSSGSAVAVARGQVAFALGTDTAGSGRVPAAFNGIYGWKPSRGVLSTSGVVPACRTLDCVSIFATTAEDLGILAAVTTAYDASDPFSRMSRPAVSRTVRRVGVPASLEFFGDAAYADCWNAALDNLRSRGIEIRPLDFEPFYEAARLLYSGPWVAERYLATRDILERDRSQMHPVTLAIIEKGNEPSAMDAFSATYRLAEIKRWTVPLFEEVDILCTPTAPTIYTIEQVASDPFLLNTRLGQYTNFMNLLDLCGVAVPAGYRVDGAPFGVTFIGQAFEDATVLSFAGAAPDCSGTICVAVCGAHMRGLPLSGQLVSLGGEFVREDRTEAAYRLFALDERRPGMVRVDVCGESIELEVWRLPSDRIGAFLEGIPAPLGLGRVILQDGTSVCGFLCEAAGAAGKKDITSFGGWRSWLRHCG